MSGTRPPSSLGWLAFGAIGINVRTLAHAIRWPPGNVGRHGVAFLVTTLICASAFVVPWYRDGMERLLRDLEDGIAAVVLIHGIIVGVGAEITYHLWLAIYRSALANRAESPGDQGQEMQKEPAQHSRPDSGRGDD